MAEKKDSQIPPLPFLNPEFMTSPPARTIRILAEYLEPAERLRRAGVRDTIVFFGSARSHSPEQVAEFRNGVGDVPETAVKLARYYQDALDLARRLTEWSLSLTGDHRFIVCSGGSGGMMEAANRGASVAGGKTMGFNIHLPQEQEVNDYVSR